MFAARAQELDEVAHVLGAGDEQDVGEPGADQLLERMIDHRPRTDREEVLVGHLGQLAHAGPFPAGKDHAANGHASLLKARP